jgi:hypothetical protein
VGSRTWLIILTLLSCAACSGTNAGDTQASSAAVGCEPGSALQGATYDTSKSRFAFGSMPTKSVAGGMVRWVGTDGVVAINATGAELGIMNAGAPETNLADWSGDPAALQAHVSEYFAGMGVQTCQISSPDVLGGSDGSRTIDLARGIKGIPVSESNAYARFNTADQSTSEGFYWPTIPSDTVAAAQSLSARVADAASLAIYQALLPANAQGAGHVVIHHTSAFSTAEFRSEATYDVQLPGGSLGGGATASFDSQGNLVVSDW